MTELGIEMPQSKVAYTVADAESIATELGYPVVVRPAFTLVVPAEVWPIMSRSYASLQAVVSQRV